MKDYYKILGVERTASTEGIKKAFYNLIKKVHPDTNPNSIDGLNNYFEILEAYKVLGNLDNRLRYSLMLNKRIFVKKKRYNL